MKVNCVIESRRGKFDILADILQVSRCGVNKTCLMQQCNLSFQQLESYLTFMTANGLLTEVKVKRRRRIKVFYKATEKGKKFLLTYKGLKILLSTSELANTIKTSLSEGGTLHTR